MKCRDLEELLSAYTDDELAGTQRDFLEEHLENCPECRALLADYMEVRRQLTSLRQIPAVPDISKITMTRIRTASVPHKLLRRLRPVMTGVRIIIVLATILFARFFASFSDYAGLVSKVYAATEKLTSYRAISDKYTMLHKLAGLVQNYECDYVVLISAVRQKAVPKDIFARLFTRQAL